MFPTNSKRLIGISDAFFAFCLRVSVIFPTCSLYPQQKRAYSALHPQAWTDIYTGHACRHLPSAVPWISEDRLLVTPLQGHFLSPRSCPPKLCWLSALRSPTCTTVRGKSQFTSSRASTYPEPRFQTRQ